MIEKKYFELINKEIDGANSKAESAKLQAYLSRNREARQLYEELLKTSDALKKIEEVEPPGHLRQHILNSLGIPQATVPRNWGVLRKIVENFRARPTRKYALVFVSGICVGVFLFLMLAETPDLSVEDTSHLLGALAPVPDFSHIRTADSAAITLGEVTGSLRTLHTNGFVVAELRLQSRENTRVELEFEPTELVMSGYKRLAGSEESLDIGQNRIAVTSSGNRHCYISFITKGAVQRPLAARIYVGSRMLYQTTLLARGAGGLR